ncbi:glycosyltransferase family 4 protein [Flavobacterium sp. K77]|uniref:glycosyltransferase family 4 protein n=1 Tax=Flavobacterium sp. K77 TaxID=2910676 RepID=UPI001F36F433|nr:glycosyltransferase family 4 protein [Flavobacterium sp. K77]MCF6142080.1 glycosyltransferase family 4 protein [Flavobacterium sp. K77]
MKVSVKPKLIRTSTVAMSLDYLLKGQLAFLNEKYDVVAVSGADDHLETVASREKVRTVSVPMHRQIKPWQDLISLWKLYRLFLIEKPQIVHSITPKAGLLSMTAAFFARVPVRMHTFTGLIFPSKTGILQQILIVMDKILCLFATHIYPEGQGVLQDLKKFGITNKKLSVLANGNVNGIDVEYFDPKQLEPAQIVALKQELNIEVTDFVYIFVGRLVADKGIKELVAAFLKLESQASGVKLLLVGPLEPELDPLDAQTLQAISQSNNILHLGFQKDVRQYFSIANALVFPSYREGFPNVVLQAGAMGLPTIATDISGCNEIIKRGYNGILVPVKDEVKLFDSMFQLATNSVFCNELASNSRSVIVEKYQQRLVWEAIDNEYNRIVNHV